MPESSHLLLLIVPAPLPQICRGSTVRGAVSIAGRAGIAPHTPNPAPYWAHRSQKRSRPSLFCGLLVWLRCPSQAQSQTARPRLRSAPLPRRWARVRTSTPLAKAAAFGEGKAYHVPRILRGGVGSSQGAEDQPRIGPGRERARKSLLGTEFWKKEGEVVLKDMYESSEATACAWREI